MVQYKCDRCGYETKNKTKFTSHENRKRPCTPNPTSHTHSTEPTARATSPQARSTPLQPLRPLHVYKLLLQSQKKQVICNAEKDPYTGNMCRFGDETMDPLTNHLIGCLFLELEIVELMAQLHFNPDYPENRNIRNVYGNTAVVKVYTIDGWQQKPVQDICRMLVLRAATIFKKYYATHYEIIL